MQRLVSLALGQLRHRNSRPPGNDPGDLILRYRLMHQRKIIFFHALLFLLQFLFQVGQLPVGKLRRLFQIALALRDLDLVADRLDLLPQLGKGFHALFLIVPLRLAVVKLRLLLRQLLLQGFQTLTA